METIKSNETAAHIVEAVKIANVDARHTIAMFILLRLQDGDVGVAESQIKPVNESFRKEARNIISWVNFVATMTRVLWE